MSSSFFGSITSEQRWTDQLNEHFIIYIDNHASIFRVPKKVCDTKPEAYAPQQIGLGAYHHLRPDLDEMEIRKLEAVKKYLKPEQCQNFKSLIVDKVKVLEPSVRTCYSKYLDIDGGTLAWIMSIDGVYLLHRLGTYTDKASVDSADRKLAQDIVMLENQMPVIVLKEILKALQPPVEDEEEEEDDGEDEDEGEEEEIKKVEELFSQFLSFCKAHTPLGLTDKAGILGDTSNPHLLSYLYNLIVKNWYIEEEYVESASDRELDEVAEKVTQVARVAAELTGQKPLLLLASLPLQKFAALFKKDPRRGNSSIEEIRIPSVSELDGVSKVKFEVWPDSGIGMKYEEEGRILYLPAITLDIDSEAILRNLVAYEVATASPKSTLILAGYVDFMCGIIDTAKDVDLLKEKGIIISNLPSEEIAKIFNGISKSSSQNPLPELEEATQKLNAIYDNTFRVKAWRFIRDHFVPSEAAVKIFLAILLVVLLTVQAFCQVYGCSARWFGKISSISSF
ncbi:unnamed protein product [Coffea canephora]|uniref:Uncharacterized protein n=1 Tax=Coffea canephora TaxID=49390 RepID=A0A068VJA3_COFCA|nr:unnamed protein product [Coffea canephora]